MTNLFKTLLQLWVMRPLAKLRPTTGDVVVIHVDNPDQHLVAALHAACHRTMAAGVHVLVLRRGVTIDHIPSDQLHRWGLRRIEPGDYRPQAV